MTGPFLSRMGVILLLSLAATNATAAAPSNYVPDAAPRMFAASGARGMVIVIVDGDRRLIQGFGETRPGDGQLPDATSLLRIGSLSKLLAVDLMVKLASDGKLHLDDTLQSHAPHGYRVPQASGMRPITLFDLATHTSGLPRSADIPADDKAGYAQARWNWLQEQGNLPAPGHAALYSNLAFDLLADALSNSAGTSYSQALQRYVTGPLGMRDTTDAPSAGQCRRLMDGGAPDAAAPCTGSAENAGSGGLYSTAADMAMWMTDQLGIGKRGADPDTAISQAIYFQRQSLASVQGMDIGGHASGLGMGWVWLAPTPQSPAIIEKTGGGGGFMTYMALVPGRQVGIFVAVTKVDANMLRTLAQHVNELAAQLTSAGASP
ncbi:D-alanyl-D-alanine-carboxypeptidase/endopeptidase AmpH [Dyella jejuensis]|uniref:D-alanyl-D-alanine-carboxypeptidase/endopeptidase AmpH n=1 Tax=Dyella jejuensis TaxID=1432009 RepID=A0ABW8JLB3_9GAMM